MLLSDACLNISAHGTSAPSALGRSTDDAPCKSTNWRWRLTSYGCAWLVSCSESVAIVDYVVLQQVLVAKSTRWRDEGSIQSEHFAVWIHWRHAWRYDTVAPTRLVHTSMVALEGRRELSHFTLSYKRWAGMRIVLIGDQRFCLQGGPKK